MTAIIEDPIQLRSKILVWAITTNVTDLIETMPPLGNYTSGVQSKKKITNSRWHNFLPTSLSFNKMVHPFPKGCKQEGKEENLSFAGL